MKVFFLLVGLFLGISVLAQNPVLPKGLPIVKNGSYSEIGYSRSDSGVLLGFRDTMWRPISGVGAIIVWNNDYWKWNLDSLKWDKLGAGGFNINEYLKKSDSILYVTISKERSDSALLRGLINAKLNISDTALMLSGYVRIGRFLDSISRIRQSLTDSIRNLAVKYDNVPIIGYQTMNFTIGGRAAKLLTPSNYSHTGSPSKLVIYFHFYGGNVNILPSISLVDSLINNGYGIATISAGDGWGNEISQSYYQQLYNYVIGHFNFQREAYACATSMGSLTALNLINRNVIPFRALIDIVGVTYLKAYYASNASNGAGASVRAAYNNFANISAFDSATFSYDPYKRVKTTYGDTSYIGIPIYFVNGENDTISAPWKYARDIQNGLNNRYTNSILQIVPGVGHDTGIVNAAIASTLIKWLDNSTTFSRRNPDTIPLLVSRSGIQMYDRNTANGDVNIIDFYRKNGPRRGLVGYLNSSVAGLNAFGITNKLGAVAFYSETNFPLLFGTNDTTTGVVNNRVLIRDGKVVIGNNISNTLNPAYTFSLNGTMAFNKDLLPRVTGPGTRLLAAVDTVDGQVKLIPFNAVTDTTGFVTVNTTQAILSQKTFSPTVAFSSGTQNYAPLIISPNISFSGTATGTPRGLFVNPIFSGTGGSGRALEISAAYNDYQLYVSGTGRNYFRGSTTVDSIWTHNTTVFGTQFRASSAIVTNSYAPISTSGISFQLPAATSTTMAGGLIKMFAFGNINVADNNHNGLYLTDSITATATLTGGKSLNLVYLQPSLIQTGFNGISRTLYVNPSLTGVTDHRAIETNIASGNGYGLFLAGTAPAYFNGTIQYINPPAAALNDTAFILRNSNTGNLVLSTKTNAQNVLGISSLVNPVAGNPSTDTVFLMQTPAGITVKLTKSEVRSLVFDPIINTTSASTLSMTLGFTDYLFNGTTTTWTLPPLTNNKRLFIYNTGSGNITLNSNGGTNTIWAGGVITNTTTVAPNESYRLLCNGTYWILTN